MTKLNKSINCVNIKGDKVRHTKFQFPYGYDQFLIWKGAYNQNTDQSVFSDRMMCLDYERFNVCCIQTFGNDGQCFYDRKPADIEKFLSMYFDKNIQLTGIEEGCNISNGYPYWVFYFRETKELKCIGGLSRNGLQ